MLIGAPPRDGGGQPFLVVGVWLTAGAERFSDDKVGTRSSATVRVQTFKVELPVIRVRLRLRLLTRASTHIRSAVLAGDVHSFHVYSKPSIEYLIV